jgi:hypothetical protein
VIRYQQNIGAHLTYKFIILDVKEYKFGPQVCFLGGFDNLSTYESDLEATEGCQFAHLRNIDARHEQFEMFHH